MAYVCDLIDFGAMEWDTRVINDNFEESDAKAILSIPLSERLPTDSIMWAFTKNGLHLVKTTYMVGKYGNLDSFHKVWVKLWSLPVAPKVRHFLWQLCSTTLHARALLKYLHIADDDTCPLCKEASESSTHALLHYSAVQEAWELGDLTRMLPSKEHNNWLDIWADWEAFDEPKMVQEE